MVSQSHQSQPRKISRKLAQLRSASKSPNTEETIFEESSPSHGRLPSPDFVVHFISIAFGLGDQVWPQPIQCDGNW